MTKLYTVWQRDSCEWSSPCGRPTTQKYSGLVQILHSGPGWLFPWSLWCIILLSNNTLYIVSLGSSCALLVVGTTLGDGVHWPLLTPSPSLYMSIMNQWKARPKPAVLRWRISVLAAPRQTGKTGLQICSGWWCQS